MAYAIDLFCGAGGMSEGLIQAGFHILFSSDISEDVELTYKERHTQLGLIQGHNTFFQRADISELTGDFIFNCIQNLEIFQGRTIPKIDAIFGGPPCQGFSLAGRRQRNDPRNMLFREYVRVIGEINPKYVVMENVEGFLYTKLDGFVGVTGTLYPDNTHVSDILQNEFTEINYTVLPVQPMDASDFGVPQRRRRVIFIAYRSDVVAPQYPMRQPNHQQVTVHEAIGDLIKDEDLRAKLNNRLTQYQQTSITGRTPRVVYADHTTIQFGPSIAHDAPPLNHALSKHSALIVERFRLYREGENTTALFHRILEEGIPSFSSNYKNLLTYAFSNQNIYEDINELGNAFETGLVPENIVKFMLSKKGNRIRYDRNSPSPTVLTLPDDFIVPFEDRIPSVRELARLQSFDDSFNFAGKRTTGGPRRKIEVPQYTQVGNAVPPLLAKAIATKILEAINQLPAEVIR
ncbi:DNA cytosine methyltransferase [Paenibacillus glucanolyticus]